ncbi:MAG TPA: hypothetical protein ENG59_08215 [Chloroflexi bacterium]|nr:MAG: hypothetical protein DRI46_05655 [Chloroflexota bacterium]HDD56209.1 hypothetical protein [Chloroflexota bacterium]
MSETEQTLTCAFHPKRETQLRCNRCNKPICIQCATHTPTGYRCPDCIRSQQKVFITTKWFDHLIAAFITAVIALFGSRLGAYFGFYNILIAIGAGYLVVLATKKAIKNRRSPLLKFVMSGAALLTSLVPPIYYLYETYWIEGYGLLGGLVAIIWRLAYALIITFYIYHQLRN